MSLTVYRDLLQTPGTSGLYTASFLARMPMLALPLTLTLLVVDGLGRSYAEAGLVAAAETLGVALGAPWRGRRIDDLGLRRAVWPSIAAVSVLYPTMAWAPYWALVPLAFCAGLFLIPIYSIVRLSLAVLVPEEGRRTAYAFDAIVAEAAFIIGPALAGVLVVRTDAHIALLVVGSFTVMAGIMFWVLNPPTRSPAEPAGEPSGEPTPQSEAVQPSESPEPAPNVSAWLTRDVFLLFCVSAGCMVTLMAADLSVIAHLRERNHLDWLWLAYGAWGLSSLLGGLIYGARSTSIRPSYLLLAMGLTTIPIGFSPNPIALALAVVPAGLFCAPVMAAASEWIAKLVSEARRGEAMGWQGTAFTMGGAAAGPLIGFAIDTAGPWGGFAFGGTVGALIAAVTIVVQMLRNPSATSVDTEPA